MNNETEFQNIILENGLSRLADQLETRGREGTLFKLEIDLRQNPKDKETCDVKILSNLGNYTLNGGIRFVNGNLASYLKNQVASTIINKKPGLELKILYCGETIFSNR